MQITKAVLVLRAEGEPVSSARHADAPCLLACRPAPVVEMLVHELFVWLLAYAALAHGYIPETWKVRFPLPTTRLAHTRRRRIPTAFSRGRSAYR
jgi:hypothetical protein